MKKNDKPTHTHGYACSCIITTAQSNPFTLHFSHHKSSPSSLFLLCFLAKLLYNLKYLSVCQLRLGEIVILCYLRWMTDLFVQIPVINVHKLPFSFGLSWLQYAAEGRTNEALCG